MTEALNATFEHADWENWDHSEGITFIWSCHISGGSYSFMSSTTVIIFVEIPIFFLLNECNNPCLMIE